MDHWLDASTAAQRRVPLFGHCKELTLGLRVKRALAVAQPGVDRATVVIGDSLWHGRAAVVRSDVRPTWGESCRSGARR